MLKKLILSFALSRGVLYTGAAFDAATTVATPGRESNPALGQNHAQEVFTIGGLTVLSDVMTRKLACNGHPKAANIINFVTGSVHVAAGTWNLANRSSVQSKQ